MLEFIMMIGIAGSGKSTFAAEIAKQHNAIIVSSDAIRGELCGDEGDQSRNAEVFAEVDRRIFAALRNGQSVIYDAMNLKAKYRRGFLKQVMRIAPSAHKVAYLVATDYEIILQQNMERERHVPEDVIERAFKHIQIPRKGEGWDKIIVLRNPRNQSNYFSIIDPCVDFDQDNPHHSNTLYDHMEYAALYVANNYEQYGLNMEEAWCVVFAAMVHDIGKVPCKTYQKPNGEIDSHAHFYGHADVGAYMFACASEKSGYRYDFMYTVMRLIQYHMDCYSDKEHWLDKIEAAEGTKFRNMIALLHEGDMNGH